MLHNRRFSFTKCDFNTADPVQLKRSRQSVNNVAERAEVDEDDDTEDSNWIIALVLNQY